MLEEGVVELEEHGDVVDLDRFVKLLRRLVVVLNRVRVALLLVLDRVLLRADLQLAQSEPELDDLALVDLVGRRRVEYGRVE